MNGTRHIIGIKHGKTKHFRVCGGELVPELVQHWTPRGLNFDYVYRCQSCSSISDAEVPQLEQDRLYYEWVGPYDD